MIQVLFQIFHNGWIQGFFIFLFEFLPVAVDIVVCHVQRVHDVKLVCSVEDRRSDLESECLCCQRKVGLQDLSDIHTAWHAQRVQHDIQRTSVRKERHVFDRKHAADNTLVTMTACHLITNGDLSLLCDIDTNGLVDART